MIDSLLTQNTSGISLPGIPRSMLVSRLSIRAATTSQALFTSLFSCHRIDGKHQKNNEQLDQVGAKNSRSKIGLGVYRLQSTESHPFRKTNDHFQFTPILRITSRSSMHWKSKWTNVRLRISLCHSQPLERLPLPACWKSPADWCVQSIPNHK